jgi:hypothetical protein
VGLISRTESRLVEVTAQLQLDTITTAGGTDDIRDCDALANAIGARARMLHDALREEGIHVAHAGVV